MSTAILPPRKEHVEKRCKGNYHANVTKELVFAGWQFHMSQHWSSSQKPLDYTITDCLFVFWCKKCKKRASYYVQLYSEMADGDIRMTAYACDEHERKKMILDYSNTQIPYVFVQSAKNRNFSKDEDRMPKKPYHRRHGDNDDDRYDDDEYDDIPNGSDMDPEEMENRRHYRYFYQSCSFSCTGVQFSFLSQTQQQQQRDESWRDRFRKTRRRCLICYGQ